MPSFQLIVRSLYWLSALITTQEYEEMTIAEIMMGKGHYFPGLIPLCEAYLEFIQCDHETRDKVIDWWGRRHIE